MEQVVDDEVDVVLLLDRRDEALPDVDWETFEKLGADVPEDRQASGEDRPSTSEAVTGRPKSRAAVSDRAQLSPAFSCQA
ncbi:MAG: hypothetical protein ABEJ08_05805 [Halobacteriaceae archaeon]